MLAGSLVLGIVWLVFLPWLGRRPGLQQNIEFLERRGVDPSAMFYTELEAAKAAYDRTARALRENRRVFYVPGYLAGDDAQGRSRN